MTEKQFIIWLRGFAEGVHHYNLTPKQWDYLKEQLNKVGQKPNLQYTIDEKIWTTSIA
jgi:hypothetical protein